MALIIEDGSIVSGAESYISAADCTTYHSNRGNAAWTGIDAVKEAALRKAAQYLDGHYRRTWKGYRVQPTIQAMGWPRIEVAVDDMLYQPSYSAYLGSDVIPQRLKDAQCELALLALSADLTANVDQSIKREKIDVIETEYFQTGNSGQVAYPHVDNLLIDYLNTKSNDLVRG